MYHDVLALTFALVALAAGAYPPRHNDWSCNSTSHPNPVVLIHGFFGSYDHDLGQLESYLQDHDFCTFSITYGVTIYPNIGGIDHVDTSAKELAPFIKYVHSHYPNSKVDMVGHSGGAFEALYLPKFEPGISNITETIIPVCPPTHGGDTDHIYDLAFIGGDVTRNIVKQVLTNAGCPACSEQGPGGAAVIALNNGPIRQPGNNITIITTVDDRLATPPTVAFVREPGVRNVFIQDYCPYDTSGHLSIVLDPNLFAIVKNTLSGSTKGPDKCVFGTI